MSAAGGKARVHITTWPDAATVKETQLHKDATRLAALVDACPPGSLRGVAWRLRHDADEADARGAPDTTVLRALADALEGVHALRAIADAIERVHAGGAK